MTENSTNAVIAIILLLVLPFLLSMLIYPGDKKNEDRPIVSKMTEPDTTLKKLASFGSLQAGWHLARGKPISPTAMQVASAILRVGFELGCQLEVFPRAEGGVLVELTLGALELEIRIEADGSCDDVERC